MERLETLLGLFCGFAGWEFGVREDCAVALAATATAAATAGDGFVPLLDRFAVTEGRR